MSKQLNNILDALGTLVENANENDQGRLAQALEDYFNSNSHSKVSSPMLAGILDVLAESTDARFTFRTIKGGTRFPAGKR